MTQTIPAHWPSEVALIVDLAATFPGIHARPARDYGVPYYRHGAWVGGEARMAGEEPIFSTLACSDPEHYDGDVHHAFIAWLKARGWLIDKYDTGVYMVISAAQAEDEYAEDLAFQDLIDQHSSLMVVVESLNARIAQERARRAEVHGETEVVARYAAEAKESLRQVAMLRSVRPDYIGLAKDNPGNKPGDDLLF